MSALSDRDKEVLDRVLLALSEHFESVQIIATRQKGTGDDEQTDLFTRGTGNWYARVGAAADWLEQQKARTHRHIVKEDEEDDDG